MADLGPRNVGVTGHLDESSVHGAGGGVGAVIGADLR